MDIYNEIKTAILNTSLEKFTLTQILKELHMSSNFDKEQIKKILKRMCDEGLLYLDYKTYIVKSKVNNTKNDNKVPVTSNKKKKTKNSDNLIEGVLRGNERGYAFLISDDYPDLFIPNKYLYGAMHGDTVRVKRRISSYDCRPEGVISKVIKRGYTRLIGTVVSSSKYIFVHPDMKEYFTDVLVKEIMVPELYEGDKVIVEINQWGIYGPSGNVVEILGQSGNPSVEAQAIIRSYDFYEPSTDAEDYAKKLNKQGVLDKDLVGRTDFTNLLTITIDGDDAKDFDDAISLEKEDDKYILYVHIADVSHYVKEDNVIDVDAYTRCTSVYFPGEVFPMIPKALSDGLCSLSEGNVRLTLTCKVILNSKGKIKGYDLIKSYIKSDHRMTYKNVTKIINGDKQLVNKYSDIYDMIMNMKELAALLHANKEARGAIDFGNDDAEIILDKDHNVVDIKPYEYTISNSIIEEFMILANEVVAEYFDRMEYPFIYRTHEQPNEEKLKDFITFARACGVNVKINNEFNSYHYQNILKEIKDTDYEKLVSKVMLRTMQKAKYTTTNIGHFGLASEYYCHFTSPIRRYPDLMIHRIIKKFLDGELDKKEINRLEEKLTEVATKSTEREISAEKAEREADDFYKAYYMKNKIGNIYEGTISGVTSFGIFVELDNTVEGMIRIEDLNDYTLEYIESAYALKGAKRSYKLGEKITIMVAASDIFTKKIRFALPKTKQKKKAVL